VLTIIRNVNVYNPEHLGIKDVLLVGNKIAAIEDNITIDLKGILDVIEIDGRGKILVPGFIDSHVHILGGGGEGGFTTRTPEATLTGLTTAGVTTVVGCLGTDGVSRDMISLLSKARGLEEEGITSYIYAGSYRLPVKTITGEVMKDIMVVDKIIGIGEIAISDHRSSQPTFDEFCKAVSDVRVGGMLSGKAGIINIHLGDGNRKIDMIKRAIEETEIPISQFLPNQLSSNNKLTPRPTILHLTIHCFCLSNHCLPITDYCLLITIPQYFLIQSHILFYYYLTIKLFYYLFPCILQSAS